MENTKTGSIIRILRQEQKLTQKQLADKLHISDKTVSKWERGLGYPDIALLPALAELLAADIQKLLRGDSTPNDFVGGNMKNTRYYVCPSCHNISLCSGQAAVSCCGKMLTALKPQKAAASAELTVETIEDDWYITSSQPMTKEDYISFVAFASGDRIQLFKQYPEWNLELRLPRRGHGMLLWYSLQQGLRYQLL
ncbi:helix-turn-helix domain-containing protein [uncultured Phascolarctobacterium sp.]|uniref:helix-turn-helix domain-containing protein n=1 Tax=uncultured Phascolarctobacterium sp. TaxID=512296 RepID=UPI0027D9489B|nr:helix-turn-helix domain-containing protein [uncultured Phascolarctobacterium sp.]